MLKDGALAFQSRELKKMSVHAISLVTGAYFSHGAKLCLSQCRWEVRGWMSVVQMGDSLWVTGGVNGLDADLYVERNSTADPALRESSSVSGLPLLQVLFSS